ncbi:ester cyclase [Phenylobacterium sp.]|uniref:ester cyclase n=1 Tax=Phenylobacterium sp. TaxID=1871053 RepID=UPI0028115A54|nr:ester cyclase [Phenylobacterium sp.]
MDSAWVIAATFAAAVAGSFIEQRPEPAATPVSAPAPSRRASNAEIDARIAAADYTAQERANIETTIRFLSAPRPIRPDDRARYFINDYKATRHGMDTLAQMWGKPHGGYNAASMNDRQDKIVDIIANGDRVWVYFQMNGHHTGPWYGREGTGRPISIHELGMLTYRDGKIVEAYFLAEELELARQLGIVPSAEEGAKPR